MADSPSRVQSVTKHTLTDAEPGTPRPRNDVFCTDLRLQLIHALIANRPALAAILFYYFTTGPRLRGCK